MRLWSELIWGRKRLSVEF